MRVAEVDPSMNRFSMFSAPGREQGRFSNYIAIDRLPYRMDNHGGHRDRIFKLIDEADSYRRKALNLQASENVLSEDVKRALSSDFASRYSHMEDSGHNSYGGTKHSEEILRLATDLACEVYGSEYAEVRPLGGHIAVLASILATCGKGDVIASIGISNGGYPGYGAGYIPDMLSLTGFEIPYVEEEQEIDYDALRKMLEGNSIKALILGQSAFVRPYDLKRIRSIIDGSSPGTSVIYDGSHVMGLIAGGQFQPDVLDYADILLGSTHKSFFGPQGGIILTNKAEIHRKVGRELVWKTMDNYHPNRVAALAIALNEMKEKGKEYAQLVAKNSRELASVLDRRGIGVRFGPWYSYSHQIILDSRKLEEAGFTTLSFSERLESSGIIVDRDGRIGTSEITHLGISDMKEVAELVVEAAGGKNVKERAESLVSGAPGV